MKTTISILVLSLASILHAQSSFIVGTNAVPVIFEDAELSQTNRVKICNDLTRVFAFESNFTNLIHYFSTPVKGAIGDLKSVGVNVDPFKLRPHIRKVDEIYALVVHEDISQSYVKCFSDMVSQTNLLQQADAFVAMLNTGETVNLTAEQKFKLVWVPEGYDQGTPEEHAIFAEYLSGFKFYPPSILSAELFEDDLFPKKSLLMTIVVSPKNKPSDVFDMTIVHDGTQWRFVRF